ncbi:unnamed protein product [Parascedosporium putredinis]|uniref:MYND-type zinc finger protein samB n=1 Tax=Parascedosporium putredinis TaxID=1442378 RepID=A0A9P1H6X2_9PEZI|nr:unnamed protein product [Parascedosporium putredinis]CAI7999311.1 unnamed protein product [Parascedosporium putredinis]
MSSPAAPPSLAVRGGPSDPKGRSLHTTSPAPALSRLATYSSPILAVPTAAASATTCHYCLRASLPGDGQLSLLPCSACRVARYCSKACQRAAWKLVHKVECPALAAAPPVAARKDAWVAVGGGLVGNEAAFRSAGAGPWADLKLLTNMFNVHDPDIGYDAVFLDGGLAMVNHSCLPNASAHIYGRTALLVADQPIAADEEITISYIDTSYPLAHRRQELEKYHFVCKCPRCHSDLNVYEAARLLPSAVSKANTFAITHDPDLSGPSTASSSATKGTKLQSTIYEALDALPEPAAADDRAHLRKQFDVCAPLVRDSSGPCCPSPY